MSFDDSIFSITDIDGRILSATAGFTRLVGRSSEGILGHLAREWVCSDDIEQCEFNLARVIAEQRSIGWLRRNALDNGRMMFARCVAFPLRTTSGVRSAICSFELLNAEAYAQQSHSGHVADYVASLATDLSHMVKAAHLPKLAQSLDNLAEQAAAIAGWPELPDSRH